VLDGTDCVMLSGETANGDFPVDAVSTMAAICNNAEEMINVPQRYNFIRNHTPKPMMAAEALCSGAVQSAIDCNAKAIICITASGRAPALCSKYRPNMPVFVVTPDPQLVRHCRSDEFAPATLPKVYWEDVQSFMKVFETLTFVTFDLKPWPLKPWPLKPWPLKP
jgi:pyruvate kinase